MKIRILKPNGAHQYNEIVDAVKSPVGHMYICYDYTGRYWLYGISSCEEFIEDPSGVMKEVSKNSTSTLRELIGQDIKLIEFK